MIMAIRHQHLDNTLCTQLIHEKLCM
uniref:Uncharacterized protein n=1 Tax=Anguilla anguilla TaxID=7936 RepID=A0A0E9UGC0_ANGAN